MCWWLIILCIYLDIWSLNTFSNVDSFTITKSTFKIWTHYLSSTLKPVLAPLFHSLIKKSPSSLSCKHEVRNLREIVGFFLWYSSNSVPNAACLILWNFLNPYLSISSPLYFSSGFHMFNFNCVHPKWL